MTKCHMCNDSAKDVVIRMEYSDEVFDKKIFMIFLFNDDQDQFIHLCQMCSGIVMQSIGREFTG